MKTFAPLSALLLLAPLAFASPIDLQTRQNATVAAPDPAAAAPDALGGDTRNDLTNGKCGQMMVIFARGTTETGNVGTLAGPQFFAALSATMGAANVAVQGVAYPADIPGFLAGGDAAGSQVMAGLVKKAATACPSSKIVMSGYSQGAQLVHNAAGMLDAATAAKVDSVVMFGDPDKGDALPGITAAKVLTVCHAGDNICAGGALILAPHLTVSYLFFFIITLIYCDEGREDADCLYSMEVMRTLLRPLWPHKLLYEILHSRDLPCCVRHFAARGSCALDKIWVQKQGFCRIRLLGWVGSVVQLV